VGINDISNKKTLTFWVHITTITEKNSRGKLKGDRAWNQIIKKSK